MSANDEPSIPETTRRLLVRARLAAIAAFVLALWAASLVPRAEPMNSAPRSDVVAHGR